MDFTARALALVVVTAAACAGSARADPVQGARTPEPKPPAVHAVLQTGLSAPDVGPLMHGVVAEGVQMLVFAGCFLALDDDQTCIEIAGKARDDVAGFRR